jgi:hypothetical protein
MGLISPRDFVDLILTKETDTYYSTNGRYILRRALSCMHTKLDIYVFYGTKYVLPLS